MSLPGAKTRRVFIPACLESHPQFWSEEQRHDRSAPAGSENPQGFHPFVESIPVLAGNQPGFHPCFNPIPNSGRRNSGMAGRAPPYGGCASPSGAQCRRKGVLCLPR
ncbi:MAG: hypothetical protein LBK61_00285, partial [Spirochaetaceae bacterium]|nr:hypothetical protein [Spirochaetaceae bacterium]